MGRVVLTICRSCEPRRKHGFDAEAQTGEALYRAVKALRRERELKPVFAVEESSCLGVCDSPCAIEFSGKKRPTYLRQGVHALNDVAGVVEAAVAYAALEPKQRLSEPLLPGEPGE